MQPIPCAVLLAGVKGRKSASRGKTCNRFQTRESVQPVSYTGKQKTGTKRGKHKTDALALGQFCFA